MRLPAALTPLRHTTFLALWSANLVSSLGTWMQNTGAGWLMTTLQPNALTVSLVQAATILPIFLLALPSGALADIVDRRRFMIGTQMIQLVAAACLATLTYAGATTAAGLLLFTFAIGVGNAMNGPPWGTVVTEVVPRGDLAQAIALNGVGFNIARAVGPAAAGFVLLAGGPSLTFLLNALSFLAVVAVLVAWRRARVPSSAPREHLLSAMRAGLRYVRNTPAVRAANLRIVAYYLPTAGPWAMLPLVVKQQLGLGPAWFGTLLALMGIGGVASGLLLPVLHGRIGRGDIVFGSSLVSCLGMGFLGLARHWPLAGLGMLLFGLGWVAASSVTQAAAQLAAPSWVRSRALAIYQLFSNGSLFVGSFFWGWLGTRIGLPETFGIAAVSGVVLALAVWRRGLDWVAPLAVHRTPLPVPEAPAPELVPILAKARGRVLETASYRVAAADRPRFLALMAQVRLARGRSGAILWQLYEDVVHPEGWMEVWAMENWTDHLRESGRLSEEDRAVLARALAFTAPTEPQVSRYIAVDTPRVRTARNATRFPAFGRGLQQERAANGR